MISVSINRLLVLIASCHPSLFSQIYGGFGLSVVVEVFAFKSPWIQFQPWKLARKCTYNNEKRSKGEKEWKWSPPTSITLYVHWCLSIVKARTRTRRSAALCVSVWCYECMMCDNRAGEMLCSRSTSVVQELNPQGNLLINIHVVHRCFSLAPCISVDHFSSMHRAVNMWKCVLNTVTWISAASNKLAVSNGLCCTLNAPFVVFHKCVMSLSVISEALAASRFS